MEARCRRRLQHRELHAPVRMLVVVMFTTICKRKMDFRPELSRRYLVQKIVGRLPPPQRL